MRNFDDEDDGSLGGSRRLCCSDDNADDEVRPEGRGREEDALLGVCVVEYAEGEQRREGGVELPCGLDVEPPDEVGGNGEADDGEGDDGECER